MKTQNAITSSRVRPAAWIFQLILAWLGAVTVELLLLPAGQRSLADLGGISQMSLLRVMVLTVLGFGIQALWVRRHEVPRWILLLTFAIYAGTGLIGAFTWPFLIFCGLIVLYLGIYAGVGWNGSPLRLSEATGEKPGIFHWVTLGCGVLFFLFVSVWTVCRVRSFCAPTYDFGIFAQMFYYLRTVGKPLTTLERDGLLSHFAVHVSPIYYLMLPVYCLFPRVETLQILQAAILASSVIPLWKLGKLYGLRPGERMLLCLLLLLYPALSGGTSYDLHENCFLTPLLLWLLWAMEKGKKGVTLLCAVLTFFVKEDAAVYVGIIACYYMVRAILHRDGKLVTAGVLLAASVGWFFLVTSWLSVAGEGVMNYRYGNFMPEGSTSLVAVVKTVFLCPMKVLYECVDAEKLKFIGLTLLPLAALPLLTRRYERLILLIPYVLVNLMSDYRYQHDIMFQYTFGSTACLFYLAVVNYADIKGRTQRKVLIALALGISCICFGGINVPKAAKYPEYCQKYAGYYDSQRAQLEAIPEDASVAATTFCTVYLSQRREIYDIKYSDESHVFSCDYIVLKPSDTGSFKKYSPGDESLGVEVFRQRLLSHGYQCISEENDVLEIYCKNPG